MTLSETPVTQSVTDDFSERKRTVHVIPSQHPRDRSGKVWQHAYRIREGGCRSRPEISPIRIEVTLGHFVAHALGMRAVHNWVMSAAELKFNDRLCMVLVRTRNPLNIGAAARAMANFGVSQLRLVSPYDPAFREARSAVGASELMEEAAVCSSVAEAVADCSLVIGTTAATNRSVSLPLITLPEAAAKITDAAQTGKVALLFGSEKRGLANEDMSYCHWLMRIPTSPQAPSMNLAQSVVVVLYELARTRSPSKSGSGKAARGADCPAEMQSLLRLVEVMHECLMLSGYYSEAAAVSAEEQLRRMLLRMKLNAADSEIVIGMFRQISWKLRANSGE
jgi:TrmH family RNA methyltransferase